MCDLCHIFACRPDVPQPADGGGRFTPYESDALEAGNPLRRATLTVLGVGAAACLSLPLMSSGNAGAAPACGVSGKLVPTCGVLWGAHSSSGYASMESQIGRPLAIVHDYTDWPATFPGASEEAAAAGGRILFVDWTARNYATNEAAATWAQIADGTQDAHINAEA